MTLLAENTDMLPSTESLEALMANKAGYIALFKNRNFMALWSAQVFGQLADRIIYVLFISLIVNHFGTSGLYKSLLYVAFTIPAIALTAVAGVFADRWDRKKLLIATNLMRAGVMALTALAVASHSLLALYAMAFLVSIATQFFTPAESATIPTVVPKPQLLVANSLFTTTMMASIIFGFALGDPLIDLLGLGYVHWAIVALFLLAAGCLAFMHPQQQGNTAMGLADERENPSLWALIGQVFSELGDGITHLHEQPKLFKMLLRLALLFSEVVSMTVLLISFAESYLFADPVLAARKFVWLITVCGIGMVLGSIALGRFCHDVPRERLIAYGFVTVGAAMWALMLTPIVESTPALTWMASYMTARIVYAYVVCVFMGIGAAMVAVPLQSIVHETIPEESRGRLMGIQFTLLSTASTLPAVLAGIGADGIGVLPMFALMGLPLLILGAKALYDARKSQPALH